MDHITLLKRDITCPICGRVSWLDSHDGWECIGELAERLNPNNPIRDTLEASRGALRSGLSVIGDAGCENEDCPSRSNSISWIERDMDKALDQVTKALEAMGVKV